MTYKKINLFMMMGEPYHERTGVLKAFYKGFYDKPEICNALQGYSQCDLMIIYGHRKSTSENGKANINLLDEHKGDYICIEKGFVKRDEYYSIGFNGLNGRADFRNHQNLCVNDERCKKLWPYGQLSRPSASSCTAPVLVCGQREVGSSVYGLEQAEWRTETVNTISKGGRRVIYRPHPVDTLKGTEGQLPDAIISRQPLKEDLHRCSCVVTQNSNCAVDAVLYGVPSIVTDIGSMALEVSARNISALLWDSKSTLDMYPSDAFLERWMARLAYTQWTIPEMQNGLPHKHLGLQ